MKSLKSLFDLNALLLIVVGAILFGARIPLPAESLINLPFVETTVQLMGGCFIIAGFAIITSRLFWIGVSVDELVVLVKNGNVAAGIVLAGLKIFSGLSIIGYAVWLALSFGAGVSVK